MTAYLTENHLLCRNHRPYHTFKSLKFFQLFFLDQIFDSSSSTKDVYKEFGRPIVLSAMDGFNGKHVLSDL